jgi:hypothetical protein
LPKGGIRRQADAVRNLGLRTLTLSLFGTLVSLAMAPGCARKEEPQSTPVPARSFTFPASEPVPEIVWKEQTGFSKVSHGSDKRKATYKIAAVDKDPEDAELAVFYFGKNQGGTAEANIERWKSQFTDATDLKRTERSANGMKQTVIEIQGTYDPSSMAITESTPKPNFRMIAAVVETPAGSYFFKLSGPSKTVESARRRYMALLDSVRTA